MTDDARRAEEANWPEVVASLSPKQTEGPTPKTIDANKFVRQARSRLSPEQFSAFLANMHDLIAENQAGEETSKKAEDIFGADNKDLYLSFQGLFSRNGPKPSSSISYQELPFSTEQKVPRGSCAEPFLADGYPRLFSVQPEKLGEGEAKSNLRKESDISVSDTNTSSKTSRRFFPWNIMKWKLNKGSRN